ncbi:hypothetical protein O181_017173 [Austropuccinia psidii MF-1]|uniref:Protein YAE1 n=1 Tax=Austropuccinia psidii MF-1 TaxID=1389203 RepID=A0A9Q3GRJ9_9BASI|nr:hypothetical protein [Austropuccinia psidii MF-1]
MNGNDDWLEGGDVDEVDSSSYQVANVEFSRLAQQFHTVGYREGIEKGKSTNLQEGFNQGFQTGALSGRHLGLLRGRAAATLAILLKADALDPRVDQVRILIREFNRYRFDQSSSTKLNIEQGGLSQQKDGVSNPDHAISHKSSAAQMHTQEVDLVRCQLQLDTILSSMDICFLPI